MKIKDLISFSSFYEQSRAKLTNSALPQSIFITVLCLIAYLAGPISMYETNDDVYYSLVFSGQLLTSTPSPYACAVNFVLSEIFTLLYTAIPDIPWYGLFHVVSIFLSIFFINYFYSISRSPGKFWPRLAVSFTCTLPFIFYIQFTKTSFVLAITGYLGLYLLNEAQRLSCKKSIFLHSLAIIFLVLSFSLRQESFFMATILCGFLMAYAIMNKKTALIVSLSVAAAIIIIFTLVHKQNYGVEWQNVFERWKKVISPIIDYDQIDYDTNKDVFMKAGWSRNDYNFLIIWGFVDENVYGQKQIDYIFKNAKRRDKITNISTALQSAISFPAPNYILTAAGLVLLWLLLYRQQYSFFCASALVPFLICIAILTWQGRFPPRISMCLIYFLPWVTLVLSGKLRKHRRSYILVVVLMVMLAIPLYSQFKDLSALTQSYRSANYDIHRLGTLASKKPLKLITVGIAFPFGGILPFESPRYLAGARFIWLCSMNQVPIQKKQIEECGMHDIFISLVSDNATYIIIQPELIFFLQRYIWEHYNIKTVVIPAYTAKGFTIYKIARS